MQTQSYLSVITWKCYQGTLAESALRWWSKHPSFCSVQSRSSVCFVQFYVVSERFCNFIKIKLARAQKLSLYNSDLSVFVQISTLKGHLLCSNSKLFYASLSFLANPIDGTITAWPGEKQPLFSTIQKQSVQSYIKNNKTMVCSKLV